MKTLEAIIEEEVALAVERIVRASRATALAAFEHHFDQLRHQSPQEHAGVPRATRVPAGAKNREALPHRSDGEIDSLATRFLAAVRSNPGQTMGALAPQVGVKPSELRVPVVRLRAKKQIKLVGQRQFACYFPVGDAT